MSEAWRAFADPSAGAADLCAGVRWIAPHVDHDPEDDMVLEALELAERLAEPAASLWLWWIGLRQCNLVHESTYASCRELPRDLREVLVWVARASGDGLAAYRSASVLATPYEKALRALNRATREYASLVPVEAAIRGGRADVSSVLALMPGGWSSAALQAYRATINDAVMARAVAAAAGVDATFPSAVVPRFTSLEADERALCRDLLSGLPGSRGAFLEHVERKPLDVPDGDLGRRAVRSRQLEDRGFPVTSVILGTNYWSASFGHASDEVVSFFSSRHPLAKLSYDLPCAMTGSAEIRAWFSELVAVQSDWGEDWTTVLDTVFLASSAAGLLPQLFGMWEELDPTEASLRLSRATKTVENPDMSLIALSRHLEAIVDISSCHREEPSWV